MEIHFSLYIGGHTNTHTLRGTNDKKQKTEFVFRDKVFLYSAGGWEGTQQTADVTCAVLILPPLLPGTLGMRHHTWLES